jgi:D-aspartate ligase
MASGRDSGDPGRPAGHLFNRRGRPRINDVPGSPLACVLGQHRIELFHALGKAGVRCAAVTPPNDSARSSRYVSTSIDWVDHWTQQEMLLSRLENFADAQPDPPVLFYQSDGDLLLVSRHRDRLRERFRFVIADEDVVETAIDKARFSEVGDRLGLPLPQTIRVDPGGRSPGRGDLAFPVIVKPITRRYDLWRPIAGHGKALSIETPGQLDELLRCVAADDVAVLVQEKIEGPESRIESYHAYVDNDGQIVGEFAGRKIRTYPVRYGESTALETTREDDVLELGREVLAQLHVRGVAKVDFKRAPTGELRLLELNPRFNLWHHLGAVAGVNLPALVYADMTATRRPSIRPVRPGVRWSQPPLDRHAAREHGLGTLRWAAWTLGVDVKSGMSMRDPMPFLRHTLRAFVTERIRLLTPTRRPN